MTRFVYPRLLFSAAQNLVQEISSVYRTDGLAGVGLLVAQEHAKAEPVATGGRIADVGQIGTVRATVVDAVAPWRERATVTRAEAAAFDLALGRALHDSLQIVPSDAAHDETWNFLSLVVMPDITVLRFPDMHPDRMFGTLRNPLRGSWVRRETLGDLTDQYPKPLGVDEMVGLFERSDMARNRPLIRALAGAVMQYDGAGSRSDWAREVFKEIRYATGPRVLDGMAEDEIVDLIRGEGRSESLRLMPNSRVDLSWNQSGLSGDTGLDEDVSASGAVEYAVTEQSDSDFVAALPPSLLGLGEELLRRVRRTWPGHLSLEGVRYVNRPDNFWTVKIQPRDGSLAITVRGNPEKFAETGLGILPDRPGSSRFKVRTVAEVDAAMDVLRRVSKRP